jgi:hypothetical protein
MKKLSTEELVETWRDDSSSQDYIALNDDGNAYYLNKLIVPAKREKERDGFGWRETSATLGADWKGIRAWCERERYWPNIWQSNDHGNVSLYTTTGRYLGGLV